MEGKYIYTNNLLDNQLFVELHKPKIDKEKIHLLIEQGANINATDEIGWNLLWHYIFEREDEWRDEIESKIDLAEIQFLIDLGIDIDFAWDKQNSGYGGLNCLYITIMAKDYETTEFLLKAGANPNCITVNSGETESLLDRATWELGTYAGLKKNKIWTETDNAIWGLLCNYGAYSIENLDALQSIPKTNELRKLDTQKELQFFGNEEAKYKAYKPLFENLYENKMIYEAKGICCIIQLKNLEISEKGISGTVVPIHIISNHYNLTIEEWDFSTSWHLMMWSDLDTCIHIPYASYSLWFAERTIKRVEKLIAENRFDEIYDVLYEGNAKNSKQHEQKETQKVIREMEILSDFAKCWKNFNPYYIKEHLDKNVIYISQWLENQLDGKNDVWHYLQCKLKEYSEKTEKGTVKAKIGYLKHKKASYDKVFGYCKPCLVVTQRGKLADTISVIEIELNEEKIAKINIGDIPKNDGKHGLIENPFGD